MRNCRSVPHKASSIPAVHFLEWCMIGRCSPGSHDYATLFAVNTGWIILVAGNILAANYFACHPTDQRHYHTKMRINTVDLTSGNGFHWSGRGSPFGRFRCRRRNNLDEAPGCFWSRWGNLWDLSKESSNPTRGYYNSKLCCLEVRSEMAGVSPPMSGGKCF